MKITNNNNPLLNFSAHTQPNTDIPSTQSKRIKNIESTNVELDPPLNNKIQSPKSNDNYLLVYKIGNNSKVISVTYEIDNNYSTIV